MKIPCFKILFGAVEKIGERIEDVSKFVAGNPARPGHRGPLHQGDHSRQPEGRPHQHEGQPKHESQDRHVDLEEADKGLHNGEEMDLNTEYLGDKNELEATLRKEQELQASLREEQELQANLREELLANLR